VNSAGINSPAGAADSGCCAISGSSSGRLKYTVGKPVNRPSPSHLFPPRSVSGVRKHDHTTRQTPRPSAANSATLRTNHNPLGWMVDIADSHAIACVVIPS